MFTGAFDAMLYVSDFRESVAFYVDLLGLTAVGFWSNDRNSYLPTLEQAGDCHFAELSAGGARLFLHGTGNQIAGGASIFHFEVKDVDAFAERLRAAGRERSEPRDMPWGWRMSFAADPDGHVLGFYRVNASADPQA